MHERFNLRVLRLELLEAAYNLYYRQFYPKVTARQGKLKGSPTAQSLGYSGTKSFTPLLYSLIRLDLNGP